MDEASVCGTTRAVLLRGGDLQCLAFTPEDYGLSCHPPQPLAPDPDRETAAVAMYRLLSGRGHEARLAAVMLNAGLIFYVSRKAGDIAAGVNLAGELLREGAPLLALRRWVEVQNHDPARGLTILSQVAEVAG
jgi:anthranilate phosphoribosyltransferase